MCDIHARVLWLQAGGHKFKERVWTTSAPSVPEGPALSTADVQEHHRGRPEETDHHGQPGRDAPERSSEEHPDACALQTSAVPSWTCTALISVVFLSSVSQTDFAAHVFRRVAVQRPQRRQLCQLWEPDVSDWRAVHLHAANTQTRGQLQPPAEQEGSVHNDCCQVGFRLVVKPSPPPQLCWVHQLPNGSLKAFWLWLWCSRYSPCRCSCFLQRFVY